MVFTGDHFNNPPALSNLVEKGVLSKLREADLNHLPLQETDLLLHEAGAPPIHTPLDVLLALPKEVKNRLYVVHTSALPEGCELRAAPTGTAGTIRLDRMSMTRYAARVARYILLAFVPQYELRQTQPSIDPLKKPARKLIWNPVHFGAKKSPNPCVRVLANRVEGISRVSLCCVPG